MKTEREKKEKRVGIKYLKTKGSTVLGLNSVQSYWASEASPTLGCSIEISRDIQCTPDKWTTSAPDQSGSYIQLVHISD